MSSFYFELGIDLPLSSLKKYTPTMWDQSLVGSPVWAISDSKVGIWRKAELESWDEKLKLGGVVFRDDRSSLKLEAEAITLSEFAKMSDEELETDSSSSEESESTDCYEESGNHEVGLGFLESSSLQRGIQTETVTFAKWENHTRGIASKMMASMGYTEGMGLGVSGQGMLNPISVKVLPPKQSLELALKSQEIDDNNQENSEKRRSRGGKRKRDKKFAAAARVAKEGQESRPDVFSLINTQLATHGEALNGDGSAKKQLDKNVLQRKKEDRRALVAFDDEVKQLKARAEKLEEMVSRNKNEKVVYEAALRKLNETRKALVEVEAAHASASSAVISKEKEKKWLKF